MSKRYSLFIALAFVLPAWGNEPTGFFGLEFGKQLPSDVILSESDSRYAATFEKLPENEKKVVKLGWQSMFSLDKIPEGKSKEAIKRELDNLKFVQIIAPPTPNRHFHEYVALVTPVTHRLGALWVYGNNDVSLCPSRIAALSDFLQKKYTSLDLTPLSKHAIERKLDTARTFVELQSKNYRVSIMCNHVIFANRSMESEWETELVKLFRANVFSEITRLDKSGL